MKHATRFTIPCLIFIIIALFLFSQCQRGLSPPSFSEEGHGRGHIHQQPLPSVNGLNPAGEASHAPKAGEANEGNEPPIASSDADAIRELVFRRMLEINKERNPECTAIYVLREDKFGEVDDAFIHRFKDCNPTIQKTSALDEKDVHDRIRMKYIPPERVEYEKYISLGCVFNIWSVEWNGSTDIRLRIIRGSIKHDAFPVEFRLQKENGRWVIREEKQFIT